MTTELALPERMWAKITVADKHWLWTGHLNNRGYGLASWHSKNRAAHVVIYELLVGSVPPGLELDHLCQMKRCVNPACLEPVTPAENQRRASLAQTHCRRAGHLRTPDSTYTNPRTGRKSCRACERERDRARAPRNRSTL